MKVTSASAMLTPSPTDKRKQPQRGLDLTQLGLPQLSRESTGQFIGEMKDLYNDESSPSSQQDELTALHSLAQKLARRAREALEVLQHEQAEERQHEEKKYLSLLKNALVQALDPPDTERPRIINIRRLNTVSPQTIESFSEREIADFFITSLRMKMLQACEVSPQDILHTVLSDQEIAPQIYGAHGYRRVATLLFGGNMFVAHQEVSKFCKANQISFQSLGWPSSFKGTATHYREKLRWIKKEFSHLTAIECPPQSETFSKLPESLKGPWGYIAYAEAEYGGDMKKAFQNMSALCKAAGVDFKDLKWPAQFQGISSEYRKYIKEFSEHFATHTKQECPAQENRYTELPLHLKGPWGYIAYAEAKCGGSMGKAFINMSALCKAAGVDFKALDWPPEFHGSSLQFRNGMKQLSENFSTLTERDCPRQETPFTELPRHIKGLWGYIAYAEAEYDGDMLKAYLNMNSLCQAIGVDATLLKWPPLYRQNSLQYRKTIAA
ncbi:hypothetical protein MRY87_12560 [bacterium]|nr:hypothetical protein [bacterium]